MKSVAWVLACAVLVSCATQEGPGQVRFANAPVVWKVNDRLAVVKPPKEIPFLRALYHFDTYYLRATRGMELQRDRRALGVNAFDEVPDSTWFTNRIGVRHVSPDEIRRGPGLGSSPDQHFPWTVTAAKVGGKTLGFQVKDARGVKFVLKFDRKHAPEVETGADVVTGRLLWAAGYSVPEDHVVYFKLSDLQIADDATVKVHGKKQKLTPTYITEHLDDVAFSKGHTIRGLASIFIDGKPLGGAPRLGVRKDDRNDLIPHELRRDQRGQKSLFAWLAHNDIKEDNTFDAYQQDPEDPSLSYVVHYLIDFGSALGSQAFSLRRPNLDFQYMFDPKEWGLSLITLGLHEQPWEGRLDPHMPGIGLYSAGDYVPEEWKPATYAQLPNLYADRIDKFWGAKIAIRFTRAQIQAAVDAGRYSHEAAATYLVDTIVARQRITAKYYFSVVNPIDEVKVEGNRLCFTDLALKYALEAEPTTFTIRGYTASGREIDWAREVATGPELGGRVCIDDLQLAKGGSRYTILEVASSRDVPATQLHVAIDPVTQRPRLVGIYRL